MKSEQRFLRIIPDELLQPIVTVVEVGCLRLLTSLNFCSHGLIPLRCLIAAIVERSCIFQAMIFGSHVKFYAITIVQIYRGKMVLGSLGRRLFSWMVTFQREL